MKKVISFTGLVFILLCFSFALTSCSSGSSGGDSGTGGGGGGATASSIAEARVPRDYPGASGTDCLSSQQAGYQVCTFSYTPSANARSAFASTENRANARSALPSTANSTKDMEAWYSVSNGAATREMDAENLGVVVPEKIEQAFNETKYSRSPWVIKEIELENDYTNNVGYKQYYEVELYSTDTSKLEAELLFDFATGDLLHSKEEIDDDRDDDKFVVNEQLRAAVEAAASGATIIDAEVDEGKIEVDAITSDGKELELEFTLAYALISEETETELRYSQLSSQFPEVSNEVERWFAINPTIAPVPPDNTEVEITKGNQTETDHGIGAYGYEVDIDDYDSGLTEYEVEFYLNESPEIIAVIVNDRRVE